MVFSKDGYFLIMEKALREAPKHYAVIVFQRIRRAALELGKRLADKGILPAAGPVRILTEPDPSLVQEGDIIVMEYADPGWTPLFPLASGIVMEVGGLMCHAAVVARELGIPAGFGITDAAAILKNGQQVKINGTEGTVATC